MFAQTLSKGVTMLKIKREGFFTTENIFVLTILITSILWMIISPESAQATVESSIKGVGLSLQKIALASAIAAFALGGVGMMFGAQWGYRFAIGTVLGVCFVLGGTSIISFFQAQIR
jgi:hypothetical protein